LLYPVVEFTFEAAVLVIAVLDGSDPGRSELLDLSQCLGLETLALQPEMDSGDEVVLPDCLRTGWAMDEGSPRRACGVERSDESVAPARPGCALLDRDVVWELIDK
jgi:hypothetical protein